MSSPDARHSLTFTTSIAEPEAQGGALRYRGVDVADLVRDGITFADVWGLLVTGRFGTTLPPAVPFPLPIHTGNLRVDVQASVAMLGPIWGYKPLTDIDDDTAVYDLARTSVMAMSYVAQSARGLGKPAVSQAVIDQSSTITERMMTRWRGEPNPLHTKAIDTFLVVAAEHGLTASTLTARVIASTGADAAASLSGAIGAMSGPLHGGAGARILPLLDDSERTGNPARVVAQRLDDGQRINGFGHHVYRADDPRAGILRALAREMAVPRYEAALELENAAVTALSERYPDRNLRANLEFWAAVILDFAEVPASMMQSIFACARLAGWCAHIIEQKREGALIRPSAAYHGLAARQPMDVDGFDLLTRR